MPDKSKIELPIAMAYMGGDVHEGKACETENRVVQGYVFPKGKYFAVHVEQLAKKCRGLGCFAEKPAEKDMAPPMSVVAFGKAMAKEDKAKANPDMAKAVAKATAEEAKAKKATSKAK